MKFKITNFLAIISILGFSGIFLKSLFDWDVSRWIDSIMFMVLGGYLFISGGYHLLFNYFQGGLTPAEVNKIVAVVVGGFSFFVGFLTLPMFNILIPAFLGVQAVISLVAIVIILLDAILPKK